MLAYSDWWTGRHNSTLGLLVFSPDLLRILLYPTKHSTRIDNYNFQLSHSASGLAAGICYCKLCTIILTWLSLGNECVPFHARIPLAMALVVLPGTAVAVLQMPRAPQNPRVGRLGGLFGAPCIPRSLPPDQPVSIRSLTPGHPQSGQWQLGYQCISQCRHAASLLV